MYVLVEIESADFRRERRAEGPLRRRDAVIVIVRGTAGGIGPGLRFGPGYRAVDNDRIVVRHRCDALQVRIVGRVSVRLAELEALETDGRGCLAEPAGAEPVEDRRADGYPRLMRLVARLAGDRDDGDRGIVGHQGHPMLILEAPPEAIWFLRERP